MANIALSPTAAVVAGAIKKEADLIAGAPGSMSKDIRHHELCQIAERIAIELYLHDIEADRRRFLKACGVA